MIDYQALKAADAALGIDDPVLAARACTDRTVTITVDVPTADIRAVLWPTLEYSDLVLLSQTRDFTVIPRDLVRLAIGAVALLDSGRTVRADDAAGWAAVLGGLSQFPTVSAASVAAVGALRTRIVQEFPEGVTDINVLYVRSL